MTRKENCPMPEEVKRIQNRDINLRKIKDFAKEYLDIELHPYQIEFLKESNRFRQFGKTTAKLVETIMKAQSVDPYSYLVYVTLSPSEVMVTVDAIVSMLREANHPPKYHNRTDGIVILENEVRIKFIWVTSDIKKMITDIIINESVYRMNILSRRGLTTDRDRYIFDID